MAQRVLLRAVHDTGMLDEIEPDLALFVCVALSHLVGVCVCVIGRAGAGECACKCVYV